MEKVIDKKTKLVSITLVSNVNGWVENAKAISEIAHANGIAQMTWTLGPAPGTQTTRASVPGATNSPLVYTANAQDPGNGGPPPEPVVVNVLTTNQFSPGTVHVQIGQAVNISVDAFPDDRLTGRVAEVKTGAAGVFSLFPQSNTSGNFQKVTQVIPVKIVIDDLKGLPLVPGMNVTVKIHR